ncbi:hypothetical protein C8R45DRAFT_1097844 [Mycena sanguinolenta]|nr:hypothetical protein C8R45DRAFT_1097844 [Mycena sanguinolenta]
MFNPARRELGMEVCLRSAKPKLELTLKVSRFANAVECRGTALIALADPPYSSTSAIVLAAQVPTVRQLNSSVSLLFLTHNNTGITSLNLMNLSNVMPLQVPEYPFRLSSSKFVPSTATFSFLVGHYGSFGPRLPKSRNDCMAALEFYYPFVLCIGNQQIFQPNDHSICAFQNTSLPVSQYEGFRLIHSVLYRLSSSSSPQNTLRKRCLRHGPPHVRRRDFEDKELGVTLLSDYLQSVLLLDETSPPSMSYASSPPQLLIASPPARYTYPVLGPTLLPLKPFPASGCDDRPHWRHDATRSISHLLAPPSSPRFLSSKRLHSLVKNLASSRLTVLPSPRVVRALSAFFQLFLRIQIPTRTSTYVYHSTFQNPTPVFTGTRRASSKSTWSLLRRRASDETYPNLPA